MVKIAKNPLPKPSASDSIAKTNISIKPANNSSQNTNDFEQFFDNSKDPVRILNKDFTVRRINRAFAEIAGVNKAEVTGRECWEVFPSPLCHTTDCRLQRVLNGEQAIEVEIERRKPDGATIPCIVRTCPLHSREGKLVGIIEQFSDITEHRRMEYQVKESEEQSKALIELGNEAGEAIVMLQDIDGIEGMQIFVSDQWLRITGYTREELLGMPFFKLLNPKDRKTSIARHRLKMSGQDIPGLYEIDIIRKDGIKVPVELTGGYSNYQGKPTNVVYLRDISEHKRLLQELSSYQNKLEKLIEIRTEELKKANAQLKIESENHRRIAEEMQFIIDSVPAYVYYQDANGRFKYLNTAVIEATGIPKEKQVGRTAEEIHKDKAKTDWPQMRYKFDMNVIKSGKIGKKTQKRILPLSKSVVWTEIRSVPILDREGKTIGLVGLTYDVTKLKNANSKIKSLYKKELKLKNQLEIQTQNRDHYVRALVHELRTSITPLLASSDYLMSSVQDKLQAKFVKNINDGALSLSKRIDELLDLSKGTVGMLQLSYSRIETRQFIKDIINYVTPRANISDQYFTVDLPPRLPDIIADEQRVRQVLLNLFDNAFKFTPKKGRINLSVSTRNNRISFSVSDTGCGIDKNQKSQIFELYKRLETKSIRAQGLGLGLALSKMFVELHGGHISFRSRMGKGTTFSFWLPLKTPIADITSGKAGYKST